MSFIEVAKGGLGGCTGFIPKEKQRVPKFSWVHTERKKEEKKDSWVDDCFDWSTQLCCYDAYWVSEKWQKPTPSNLFQSLNVAIKKSERTAIRTHNNTLLEMAMADSSIERTW